tara:strand:+ start:7629 stop:8846 length:1218 start_codon:yes stop_codon:yes gene_type:complete
MTNITQCKSCKSKSIEVFFDFGKMPIVNNLLIKKKEKNKFFPLGLILCKKCYFVQTKNKLDPKKCFNKNYPYFSSTSKFWLDHAKDYCKKIEKKIKLKKGDQIVELASNDGYLLKNFDKEKYKIFGVEPTKPAADIAIRDGIKTYNDFFSSSFVKKKKLKKTSKLIIANNVFAHIPNINDFTKGVHEMMEDEGVFTIEFQHLLNMLKFSQFDTVYHEHYSYLSIIFLKNLFKKYDLKIWKIEKLNTHGGSLRVYVSKKKSNYKIQPSVKKIINEEILFGLKKIKTYKKLQNDAKEIKNNLVQFFNKNQDKEIHAYGAAAKGIILLNYCGITDKKIKYIYDAGKLKINKYIGGPKIKILQPNKIKNKKIDYMLILPWNLKKEISQYVRKENKKIKFIIAIPKLEIF